MRGSRSSAGERIVEAAIARLRERGISVALDGISLEEAIAASGVSRATAYRHWPNRAGFLSAVLVRAVRETHLEPESDEEIDAFRALLAAHPDPFTTEAGRRTITVESLRIAAEADFRRLAASRQWRDYLALCATCDGLPEGEVRDTVTAELAAAEQAFTARRATVYSRLPDLLGYRLVSPLTGDAGFTVMAEAMGALMTGLVVRARSDEGAEENRSFRARAFGSSIESEWTVASYALVAAVLSYLEPDPAVEWNAERIAASIASFHDLEREILAIRAQLRQE